MLESYVKRLNAFRPLSRETIGCLLKMHSELQHFPPRTDVVRKGDKPENVIIILEGWLCRYHVLHDGSRQISEVLLPGDACNQFATSIDTVDHAVGTITESKVAAVKRSEFEKIQQNDFLQALRLSISAELSTLRRWVANLGRQSALNRLSHFICELHTRMSIMGLAHGTSFHLPLTQEELSDALGLTAVHTNRTLKKLREMKIISFKHQHLVITDIKRLRRLADFDPDYLKTNLSTERTCSLI